MEVRHESEKSRDILVVEPNPYADGKDYVIGDVHGSAAFQSVLNQLGEHDRLFIVGDLVDRGKESAKIVDMILNHATKNKGQIFAVRGDHENMCLKTIEMFEGLAKIINPLPLYEVERLALEIQDKGGHLTNHADPKNGGVWLSYLFYQEMGKDLEADENEQIKEINVDENGAVVYGENSRIKKIKNYFESLPYIMHVEGNAKQKPFNVVHADMPFNDAELNKRIKSGEGLTEEEKMYVTWAREKSEEKENKHIFVETGRLPNSTLTYVGHSIVVTQSNPIPPVRDQTNTVDIDVGAFAINSFLMVDHTNADILKVSANQRRARSSSRVDYASILNGVETRIKAHLQKQRLETKEEHASSSPRFFKEEKERESEMTPLPPKGPANT